MNNMNNPILVKEYAEALRYLINKKAFGKEVDEYIHKLADAYYRPAVLDWKTDARVKKIEELKKKINPPIEENDEMDNLYSKKLIVLEGLLSKEYLEMIQKEIIQDIVNNATKS